MACVTLQSSRRMPAVAEENEIRQRIDAAWRNGPRILMTLAADRDRREAGTLFRQRARVAMRARQLERRVAFMAERGRGADGGAESD
jgi:hypothetical protein